MILITSNQLSQLGASNSNVYLKYATLLNDGMNKYDINTNQRICHFLSQVYVESNALSVVKENLNYNAKRLTEVWPKRFPTLEIAQQYEKNSVKLAEKVYSGRMGNNKPGDGGKYLGRGLKQLTGKSNYQEFSDAIGVDFVSQPELLEQPLYATLSACWFWSKNNLNNIADKGGLEQVVNITKIVNGGTNGLKDREHYYKKAIQIWK